METKGSLFLTIDDFPTRKSAELLDFLSDNTIPAMLFCIGKNLEKQEAIAIEALQRGFMLGNHAYSHRAFSGLRLNRAFSEIEKTDAILQRIYAKANVNWEKKYFRFPFGDKGDGNNGRIFTVSNDPMKRLKKRKIQRQLAALNYSNLNLATVSYDYYTKFLVKERDVSWTLDTMEWCLSVKKGMFGIKNTDDLLKRLFSKNPFDCRGNVPASDYGLLYKPSAEVVLMHDTEGLTDIVKLMLDELISRGYSFGNFT